jgi:hypothetical protein
MKVSGVFVFNFKEGSTSVEVKNKDAGVSKNLNRIQSIKCSLQQI